jgi:hypothetical protein
LNLLLSIATLSIELYSSFQSTIMRFFLLLSLPLFAQSQAQNGNTVCLVCGEGKEVNQPDVTIPNSPGGGQETCGEAEALGLARNLTVVTCVFYPPILADLCCASVPTAAPAPAPTAKPVANTPAPVPAPPTPSPTPTKGDDANAGSPLAANPKASPTPAPTPTRSTNSANDASPLQDRKDPNDVFGGGEVSSKGLSSGGKAGLSIALTLAGILCIIFIFILVKNKKNTPKLASTSGLVLDPDGSDMKLSVEQGEGTDASDSPLEDVAVEGDAEAPQEDMPSRIII